MLLKLYNLINNLPIIKKLYFNYSRRNRLYYLIAKLTSHDISFSKTILELQMDEVQSKSLNATLKGPLFFILKDIYQRQQAGADIARAFGEYIPETDRMMISAFEGEDISKGFEDLVKYNDSIKAMQKAYRQALAYPAILMLGFLGAISYICISIVPKLTTTLTPETVLSPLSAIIVWMSNNYFLWFLTITGSIAGIIAFLSWALPNLNNRFRIKLEGIPPFSLYRVKMGCSFLSALIGLTNSGLRQVEALEKMEREAKPYLKTRLKIILKQMNDGKNLGQALVDSKLNFPDKEMVKPLNTLARNGVLESSLEKLSQDLNEDGLEIVNKQAGILRIIVIGLLGMGILFSFVGVITISQDMTNAISSKGPDLGK